MAAKRPTRKAKTELSVEGSSFLSALMFVNQAQEKAGLTYQRHCHVKNGWVLAYNGLISAGSKVPFDFHACPQTDKLIAALNNCGSDLSIINDESSITIKSGKFKAHIDCVNPETMPYFFADNKIANLTNSIKEGFKAALIVADESSDRPFAKGALLQGDTIACTDGVRLIEYWHGVDLPPGMVIPVKAMRAVISHSSNLTGFGFSNNSVTFHFEDESFIRSGLLDCKYPDYERLFATDAVFNPLPLDFIKAIETILPFSNENIIYLEEDKITTDKLNKKATVFEVEPLPNNKCYNGAFILQLKAYLDRVAFANDKLYFFGENCRGIIMGKQYG